jgi:UDP-N-acetylmuramate--alanine ligase
MTGIEHIKKIYFIGIGGIGMSALARYFHSRGAEVSGYDRTATDLTRELEAEGMHIHYTDDVNLIPKDADMVVYTPAIPAAHTGLNYYRDHQYAVLKRSEVLGLITQSGFNICVGGTHGKTTISSMVGHVLRHTGYGCNAFLGGIAANYGTNFWSSERNVCVIEADEYDRSFLRLNPDVAVISAMDADHLDIYGTEAAMQDAFVSFSQKIKPGGLLVCKKGLAREADLVAAHKFTYHLSDTGADVHTLNLRVAEGSYHFDVQVKERRFDNIVLNVGGLHNVENALAAITIALHLGIDEERMKAAVAAFSGVKRRFEYAVKSHGFTLVDDYAHHPEELRALITGARSLFSGKKITIVFQPHLYTRTRDLATGFAQSLDMADAAILLPIYPARELPIERVSSDMIAAQMKLPDTRLMEKNEFLRYINEEWMILPGDKVLLMAGAGDIDLLVPEVKSYYLDYSSQQHD